MSYHSDDREVLQFLREQLDAARIEYSTASAEFDLIAKDLPSGIPQPDGTLRIHKCGASLQGGSSALHAGAETVYRLSAARLIHTLGLRSEEHNYRPLAIPLLLWRRLSETYAGVLPSRRSALVVLRRPSGGPLILRPGSANGTPQEHPTSIPKMSRSNEGVSSASEFGPRHQRVVPCTCSALAPGVARAETPHFSSAMQARPEKQ